MPRNLANLLKLIKYIKTSTMIPWAFILLLVSCVTTGGKGGGAPLLWEVAPQADGGGGPSYLFGTVHVGVNAESEVPGPVWSAFDAAPCFIAEADNASESATDVMKMGLSSASLRSQLKPADWSALQRELGMAPATLDHLQPWYAAIQLLQTRWRKSPSGHQTPMDDVFLQRARSAHKHIYFLETWREALTAFAAVTDADALADLVEHPETSQDQVEDLVSAYRSGNEEQLVAAVAKIDAETQDGKHKADVLITGRNQVWTPRLLTHLQNERCFVAVGTGHLIGEDNLRRQLAAAGWQSARLVP